MTHEDIDALMTGIAPVIREYVAQELAPLKAENEALRSRLDAVELVAGLRKAIAEKAVRR